MYNIARASDRERTVVFRNTAENKGMGEGVIEKDFWVCLTLDYLFHRCRWQDRFAFKGGTSLSKAYGLIERFSEDIDLILDWRVIGYGAEVPWENRSNTKQIAFNTEANRRAAAFLSDEFVPVLRQDMTGIIGREANIYIDPDDPQVVDFEYPCLFTEGALLRAIRLEIGALAAWTPVVQKTITPYIAEVYRDVFSLADTSIRTTSAERSFWEKAVILHHEAHRPENSRFPRRYSRHYYDLYCLGHSPFKEKAFQDLALLSRVVAFNQKFYPRGWAKFDEAKPGTMKLMPPEYFKTDLKNDYANMRNMIYGEHPSFEELMAYINELEKEINRL